MHYNLPILLNSITKISSIFLPSTCQVCYQRLPPYHNNDFLCYRCTPRLKKRFNSCLRCSSPKPSFHESCSFCNKIPKFINSINYLWDFDQTTRDLIHVIKYENNYGLCKYISELLNDNIKNIYQEKIPNWDYIFYIPTQKNVLKKRGFNQAETLAKSFGKRFKIQVVNSLKLVPKKSYQRQATLNIKDRNKNLKFIIDQDYQINDSKILLIDDVITTGSTIFSAVKTLQSLGNNQIDVLTLARAHTFYSI